MSDGADKFVKIVESGLAAPLSGAGEIVLAMQQGALKGSVGGAAYGSIGGASPASLWFQTTAAHAQSLIPTLLSAPFATDCFNAGAELELGAAVGSAVTAPVPASSGGVIECATGATANSARIIRAAGAQLSAVVANLRTAKYATYATIRLVTLPATYIVNACDMSDGVTGDTFLGAIQTASAVNWAYKVGSGANTDTGVAFTLGWKTLAQVADGTNVFFYVGAKDGTGMTLIATASQATAPNNPGYWQFLSQNLATAAACTGRVHRAIVLVEEPTDSQ